ncbi:hypothetical protein LAZ67_18000364 [Cordylochernes scorpioides]|uniref:Peptidase A2 domain-containing protein n=1 Tax=Cordylochernes scorpioides TaxID=51811 RepID=A0ABY6LET7_9ARAC|nr:hypothetical protein LAZ67_18000364 [Cordylochernes scorpioides]
MAPDSGKVQPHQRCTADSVVIEDSQLCSLADGNQVVTEVNAGLTRRLFITDRRSAYLFLVDTGAEVSVIPPPVKNARPSHRQLFAANGSIIHTYGERRLELDLGLERLFRWPFIIAGV